MTGVRQAAAVTRKGMILDELGRGRDLTPVLRRPVEPAGERQTCHGSAATSAFDPERTWNFGIRWRDEPEASSGRPGAWLKITNNYVGGGMMGGGMMGYWTIPPEPRPAARKPGGEP